jgi:iron complex transport system substrate-binding protein
VLNPPSLVVLGFFDVLGRQRWSPGRSPVLARVLRNRTAASLPAARLGCPGWFAADAAETLARAAR